MTLFPTPDPVLHPPSVQQTEPVLDFSYAPDGSECDLSCGDLRVRWSGHEAAPIIARVTAGGPAALAPLWAEHEHRAVPGGDA